MRLLRRYLQVQMLIGVAILGCTSDPLPESYGIYTRSTGHLTTLAAAPPGPTGPQVDPAAEFILFDNRLAPGQDLTRQLGIIRPIWVRSTVDQIVPAEKASPTKLLSTPLNSWSEVNSGFLAVDRIPVEGKTNMLILRPREPLKAGVYHVFFFKETYPFVVGPGAAAAAQQADCLDAWRTALDKDAPFSWSNWFTTYSAARSRTAQGHLILKTEYKACPAYDEFAPRFERELKERATRRIRAAAEETARAAAAEAQRQETLVQAKRVSRTIATFLDHRSGNQISVTDASITGLKGTTSATGGYSHPDDAVLYCDLYEVDARFIESQAELLFPGGRIYLKFSDDAERSRFEQVGRDAWCAWRQRFPGVCADAHWGSRCAGQ